LWSGKFSSKDSIKNAFLLNEMSAFGVSAMVLDNAFEVAGLRSDQNPKIGTINSEP